MNACKECKWWKQIEERAAGTCSRLRRDESAEDWEPPIAGVHGSDGATILYTDGAFGCIHFEASHPAIDIGKDAR